MWPNTQKTGDLVTFTEEMFHGKPHFLVQWFLQITEILNPWKPAMEIGHGHGEKSASKTVISP